MKYGLEIFMTNKNNKVMKANEIITRIRQACDAIYEKYEGNSLIEKDDILAPFEDIINDYYEDLSPM